MAATWAPDPSTLPGKIRNPSPVAARTADEAAREDMPVQTGKAALGLQQPGRMKEAQERQSPGLPAPPMQSKRSPANSETPDPSRSTLNSSSKGGGPLSVTTQPVLPSSRASKPATYPPFPLCGGPRKRFAIRSVVRPIWSTSHGSLAPAMEQSRAAALLYPNGVWAINGSAPSAPVQGNGVPSLRELDRDPGPLRRY